MKNKLDYRTRRMTKSSMLLVLTSFLTEKSFLRSVNISRIDLIEATFTFTLKDFSSRNLILNKIKENKVPRNSRNM